MSIFVDFCQNLSNYFASILTPYSGKIVNARRYSGTDSEAVPSG